MRSLFSTRYWNRPTTFRHPVVHKSSDRCRHPDHLFRSSAITINMNDSPARIDPEEAEIGRPTQTARRLVEASVSPNTRRAGAGALRRLDGREFDDVALAAYLAELHDAGRASSSASMAVAAACFRAKLAGQPSPRVVCGRGRNPTLRTVIDIDLPTSRRRSLSFAAWHAWDAARCYSRHCPKVKHVLRRRRGCCTSVRWRGPSRPARATAPSARRICRASPA